MPDVGVNNTRYVLYETVKFLPLFCSFIGYFFKSAEFFFTE